MTTVINLNSLSKDDKIDLLTKLNAYHETIRYNKLGCLFPDTGPYARHLFPKSLTFFEAGKWYKERAFIGGNRSSKSFTCLAEIAFHCTGKYPDFWTGKRFDEPVSVLCMGMTHDHVVKVAQHYLLGQAWDLGSGFIPKEDIIKESVKSKPGVPNGISQFMCKHYTDGIFDGYSTVDFMAYTQGREVVQGDTRHVVHEDEENPDPEIHSELVMRTATAGGISLISFTPLNSLTPTVESFCPGGEFPRNKVNTVSTKYGSVDRYIENVTWDDVPESMLSKKTKAEMIAAMQPWEIEARTMGRPGLGAGKIFVTPEKDFVIEPFSIPSHWPRAFGLDIPMFSGRTACVWAAKDPVSGKMYIYDSYVCESQLISTACMAIRNKGQWIPGVIDPSSKRKAPDGEEFVHKYRSEGLDLQLASAGPGSVATSIIEVNQLIAKGMLFVMSDYRHLNKDWLTEYRSYRYHRTAAGVVEVAKNQKDDLMDATRYLFTSGVRRFRINPEWDNKIDRRQRREMRNQSRSDITGY